MAIKRTAPQASVVVSTQDYVQYRLAGTAKAPKPQTQPATDLFGISTRFIRQDLMKTLWTSVLLILIIVIIWFLRS